MTQSYRDSEGVLTMILAGGVGERLRPLTQHRCKPAIPFGGTLRVIDFSLMSCVSSGLRQVYVLTQYQSRSLTQHFHDRWDSHPELQLQGGGIKPLPPNGRGVYQGTADAVYKNLELFRAHEPPASVVLILSGDHVYHADYQRLVASHLARDADVTVLSGEVPACEASSFGVLRVDLSGRVTRFVEKPANPFPYSREGQCSINLGVYCFRPQFLAEQLVSDAAESNSSHDFGRDVLPRSLNAGTVLSCPLSAVAPDSKPY